MSDEEGRLIEEIVEDVWDCSSCGKQGIRGRELACPACSNGREQTEAYRDGDGIAVTDSAALALAGAGANWKCGYCDMDNRAAASKCERCGASFEAPKPAEPDPVAVASAVLETGAASGGGLGSLMKVLAVGWLLLMAGGFAVDAWSSRARSGTVARTSWSRFVYVEKRVEQVDEDWDKAPEGAKVLESKIIPDGGGYRTEITGYRPDVERWTEKVRDGDEAYTVPEQRADGTETYYVSEQVQDGYRTTTRTERVQTGTTKELVRTERLNNGFSKKIYREVPVYGSKTVEDRVPRYRTVQVPRTRTRYRTVHVTKYRPRYKDVQRSKPIKVPITRQVPIPRTKVKFSHQVWKDLPPIEARGEGPQPAWPTVSLAGEPEPEREKRRAELYEVKLSDGSSEYNVSPKTEPEYLKFAVGQKRKFKLENGGVQLLD